MRDTCSFCRCTSQPLSRKPSFTYARVISNVACSSLYPLGEGHGRSFFKHGYFFHKCVRFFPDVNKKIAGSQKTQVERNAIENGSSSGGRESGRPRRQQAGKPRFSRACPAMRGSVGSVTIETQSVSIKKCSKAPASGDTGAFHAFWDFFRGAALVSRADRSCARYGQLR